jgi:hypothetical protein
MIQSVIVYLILTLAVGYALWHIYKSFSKDAEPCCSCEGCPLKGQNCHEKQKKPECCQKK